MPKKQVEATARISDSYLIDLQTRQFSLQIDQPSPSGKDTAPTPLEYYLCALAGCMCTIGKTIAQQKKIDLKSIDVKIVGDINTDYLLGKTKEGRAGFTEIQMYVAIDAPLSKEEKISFVEEIEERCPLADNTKKTSVINVIVS